LTAELGRESVDYIFTDPPYGGNIAYLDLSILWNHWLGFEISPHLRQSEAIVGGECEFTDEHYRHKLSRSIRECVTLLKPDRWFSVVFQHWNVSYFASILESARDAGADLRAAVVQEPRVIWSMHKKKNSESVLAGEMILTFYKSGARSRSGVRARQSAIRTLSLPALIDGILASPNGNGERLTTEGIFNRLVLQAWNNHSLSTLSISPEELADQLRSRGWEYDSKRHLWTRASQKQRLLFS
jgi:adenine-specific DNA methylase